VDGGRILVDASPDEFFSDAAHPRLREFLGQVLAYA